jgi:hypothetical protein
VRGVAITPKKSVKSSVLPKKTDSNGSRVAIALGAIVGTVGLHQVECERVGLHDCSDNQTGYEGQPYSQASMVRGFVCYHAVQKGQCDERCEITRPTPVLGWRLKIADVPLVHPALFVWCDCGAKRAPCSFITTPTHTHPMPPDRQTSTSPRAHINPTPSDTPPTPTHTYIHTV